MNINGTHSTNQKARELGQKQRRSFAAHTFIKTNLQAQAIHKLEEI
jgi:hypothetical protein